MMKLAWILVVLPLVRGFQLAPATKRSISTTTLLQGTSRPDASDAIAEALRISKEFGASSDEARVAWDIVEELDASDSSPAITTTTTAATPQEIKQLDYASQVRGLAMLLQETRQKMAQIKDMAANLRNMELHDPSLAKLPNEAEPLKSVLAEAKAAMEAHGPNSLEALKAWSRVEDCVDEQECLVEPTSSYRYSAAALKAHHYYDAAVDAEFLQEAVDAMETIDSLRRFIQVEHKRLSPSGGGGASP